MPNLASPTACMTVFLLRSLDATLSLLQHDCRLCSEEKGMNPARALGGDYNALFMTSTRMPHLLLPLYLHLALTLARPWEVNQVHCLSSHGLLPPVAGSCYAAIHQISPPVHLGEHVITYVMDELPSVYRSGDCVVTIERQEDDAPLMNHKAGIYWRRNTKRLVGDVVKCFEEGRGEIGTALTRSWIHLERRWWYYRVTVSRR